MLRPFIRLAAALALIACLAAGCGSDDEPTGQSDDATTAPAPTEFDSGEVYVTALDVPVGGAWTVSSCLALPPSTVNVEASSGPLVLEVNARGQQGPIVITGATDTPRQTGTVTSSVVTESDEGGITFDLKGTLAGGGTFAANGSCE